LFKFIGCCVKLKIRWIKYTSSFSGQNIFEIHEGKILISQTKKIRPILDFLKIFQKSFSNFLKDTVLSVKWRCPSCLQSPYPTSLPADKQMCACASHVLYAIIRTTAI
jgi:hypothetical protein